MRDATSCNSAGGNQLKTSIPQALPAVKAGGLFFCPPIYKGEYPPIWHKAQSTPWGSVVVPPPSFPPQTNQADRCRRAGLRPSPGLRRPRPRRRVASWAATPTRSGHPHPAKLGGLHKGPPPRRAGQTPSSRRLRVARAVDGLSRCPTGRAPPRLTDPGPAARPAVLRRRRSALPLLFRAACRLVACGAGGLCVFLAGARRPSARTPTAACPGLKNSEALPGRKM